MFENDKSRHYSVQRRQALKLGAAAAAAGVLSSELVPGSAIAKDLPPGPTTVPFVDPLPVYTAKTWETLALSPLATESRGSGECGRASHQGWTKFPPQKFYTLHVKEGAHKFHRDLPWETIWGYDGIVPGPTFVARYGEPILVRIYNELPAGAVGFGSPEISTHMHNLHLPSESDGFAGDYFSPTKYGPTLTAPGSYQDHHYVNCYAGYDAYPATNGDPREALGTLWYHDHRMDFTAPNVYKGLAGMYLLFDDLDSGDENDPNTNALRLPSGVGKYDIPLVFNDKQFDSSGHLYFDQFDTEGFLGNKFCVNGKIQPYFNVERRKYRFRLLDGGPSRLYEFYLTTSNGTNQTFTYIANDGNLLPAPLRTMRRVAMSPAERADIVIDFSQYETGTKLYIVNRLIQIRGRGPEDALINRRARNGDLVAAGTQILQFVVGALPAVADVSQVPDKLRDLAPINVSDAVRTRRFEFDRENEVWTVNGRLFDVENARIKVKRGTSEIWVLKGKGSWTHPLHVHLEEGRILSRNGVAPPPHERGRKDVFVLAPGEEVRVFLKFRDWTGKYMMHCHNTIHEDHAMMMRFDVES